MWRARASHRSPLLNIPASGRRTDVGRASLLTFYKGKRRRAVYIWDVIWDVAGLLREIGLLPEL